MKRELLVPLLAVTLLISALLWLIVGLPQLVGAERAFANIAGERTVVDADGNVREYGYGLVRFNGVGAERQAWERRKQRRRADDLQRRLTARVLEVRDLRRTLKHQSSVREAIELAATVYGNRPTLWRKARCESRLLATAKNRRSTAAGLFQFLDSTWASTPFGGFDVYSPYANALAAGWMHGPAGRAGEWECQ